MTKTASEIEADKIRARMAAKDKARGVKPLSPEQQQFNQQMQDQAIDRSLKAVPPKKPRKPKY